MTTAQRRQLAKLARSCVEARNYAPLVGWVDMYAARPRSALDVPPIIERHFPKETFQLKPTLFDRFWTWCMR